MAVERVHDPACTAYDVVRCVQPGCGCWCHDREVLDLPPRNQPTYLPVLELSEATA